MYPRFVVTSTQGTGGVISTLTTVGDYASGVNALTVADATGILPRQAVDRGDGTAIHVPNCCWTNN